MILCLRSRGVILQIGNDVSEQADISIFWSVRQKHSLPKRRYISIQAALFGPTVEYNLILIAVWKFDSILTLYRRSADRFI